MPIIPIGKFDPRQFVESPGETFVSRLSELGTSVNG